MATYMEDAEKAIAEEKKRQEELAEQKKAEQNKLSDEKIAAAQESVALQKQQTNRDYIDVVRNAEIQREMDLRNIRETRANMGLSRSGLSSTEQTAAVLSAGNKSALALRQKQAAVDELNRSLMEYKTATEDERRANLLAIDEAASNNVSAYGAEMKKHAMDKASDDYQAAEKANADIIKTQASAASDAEKARISAINALKDGQVPTIANTTHGLAIQNGWSVNEAIAFDTEFKRAADLSNQGKITDYQFNRIVNLQDANAIRAVLDAKDELLKENANEQTVCEMIGDAAETFKDKTKAINYIMEAIDILDISEDAVNTYITNSTKTLFKDAQVANR